MNAQPQRRGFAAIAIALSLAALAVAALSGNAFGRSAQASAAKTVSIKNFAFHPGTMRVPAGSRITFSNRSPIAHTATDRGAFDTGHIRPGTGVTVRFKHRGTFAYHCSIHPFMHGRIVVE
jgi:plastocyanin